jgi:hypothetical protein
MKTSSSLSKKSSLPEGVGHSVFKKSRAESLARKTPLFSDDFKVLDITLKDSFF